MMMLAKGNRSKMVTQSCREYDGFYLGSIGGLAARLRRDCITNSKTGEYSELGMEAIFMLDFSYFIYCHKALGYDKSPPRKNLTGH